LKDLIVLKIHYFTLNQKYIQEFDKDDNKDLLFHLAQDFKALKHTVWFG